ncbi:unnamed protein product, partial [Porites lobata]
NQTDAVVATERCISDIRTWMLTDKLKSNDDKTEFMLIGAKQQLSKVNIASLTVWSIEIAPLTVATNLGTWTMFVTLASFNDSKLHLLVKPFVVFLTNMQSWDPVL